MADIEKNVNEEAEEVDVIVLTDSESGEDMEFEVLASAELDGQVYYALAPVGDEGEEYVILKAKEDGEELIFESVDDDDEFEKVEEYFNDLFFNEIDCDN